MLSPEFLPLILFLSLLIAILVGFPVAFTLGGISFVITILFSNIDIFAFLPHRIFGTMNNFLFLAIPLFVFMGITLEKSGIAEEMLTVFAKFLRKINGGLALSIVFAGAILGATTGIVGATVTTMGIISLPVLMRYGYPNQLSSGVITASGTLGQIVPPSIVLVLLGSTMQISVGDLFTAALVPSAILVGSYLIYIYIYSHFFWKEKKKLTKADFPELSTKQVLFSCISPVVLVIAVLGSIYAGIASPTEAAGLGAFVAIILCLLRKKLSFKLLMSISKQTCYITSMVFTIFFGASVFGLLFRELNGDYYLVEWIQSMNMEVHHFLIMVLILMFILGFFIDFIEIIFIFIPILLPVMKMFDINLVWVAILIALNLQTSFITPPFGFSLFYLKGVAPPSLKTKELYLGAIPFIILQVITLVVIYLFPDLCFTFLN